LIEHVRRRLSTWACSEKVKYFNLFREGYVLEHVQKKGKYLSMFGAGEVI